VDKRSLVLYLSGLAATGAVIGLAASCSDQPRIKCTAGHGPFAVVYTHVSGDTGCAPMGEEMGVEAYNYPLPDNSNLDPNRGSLGMQSFELTAEMDHHPPDMDSNHKPYSLGDWGSAEPGGDNFCNVPSMNTAEQVLAYVPAKPPTLPDGGGGAAAVPYFAAKYEWKNVRFYNSPASPGTQLIADLTYTHQVGDADGGMGGPPCTETVKAVGVWPFADCSADEGPGIDESKCSPFPDNSKGRPLGSGISPDLATRCHPDLHWCVLAKDPPSFK
jgi:hypothetical protein